MSLTTFEEEVRKCRDCMVYEERHHDQYCRKLGLEPGSEIWIHTLRSGMTMKFSADTPEVPIWWDYILCEQHKSSVKA